MKLEEAIMYALEGSAILFVGAGFSYGAQNKGNRNFPLGDDLCERLINDGQIDVSTDSDADKKDLAYIAERYLEVNTRQDLISFLRQEFFCKEYTEIQREIANIKWKRIYTTNYDNIIESISSALGIDRASVTMENDPSEISSSINAIIHMNGYINQLTEKNLDVTFKLLTSSYQKRTLPDSGWAISLHNDILNAKCFIFIGYSMDYDLELQQILAESADIKDKCIFITKNCSRRMDMNLRRFGTVYDIGSEVFVDRLKEIRAEVEPAKQEYVLRCLKKVSAENVKIASNISDKDITDLFFSGTVRMGNIYSVERSKYIVSREYGKDIIRDITGDYRAVIIHSDIGNGKSILLREMEVELANKGTVFFLNNLSSFLRDDMDHICTIKGVKFIVIENYNRIIDSEYVKIFALFQRDDIRFIFSVRSYLNENLYLRFVERFKIPENQIAMYDVNTMTKDECKDVCNLLNAYSLWGKRAADTPSEKFRYLNQKCNGEFKSILLDLLHSENMQKKIKRLINTLFMDKDLEEITLLTFICETIAIELTLDDIVLLLNKQVKTAGILKNDDIREFFDFNRTRIHLKSPVVAYYVLQNYNYNPQIEEILKRILPVLDRHKGIDRYKNMLRMLISYSNLRMIFSKKDKNYSQQFVRIFEISKGLDYHKKNPFFWLQYAMARMELKQYKEAEIYLSNAEAFAHERYDRDSWQIDTHKARLLLEKTVAENNAADAFINFEMAFHLLHDNKTPDQHYPLRQVSLFEAYYKKFYKGFTESEKSAFLFYCIEMQKSIEKYLSSPQASVKRNRRKNQDIRQINKMLEKIRGEMVI